MFSYHRILRRRQPLQRYPELRPSRIPHSNRDIPQKSAMLRATHSRPAKSSPKFLRRQCSQSFERNHGFGNFRSPIPRTNILANIASKNIPANRRPILLRHRAPQLNREIRNASPRIQLKSTQRRRHDRLRWTSLNAPSTTPTPIRRLRIQRYILLNFKLIQKVPQQKIRPLLLANQDTYSSQSTPTPPREPPTSPATAPYPHKPAT